MKIALKTKIYLAISISLVLTLLLITLIILPLLKDIKERSRELVLAKEKLTLLESQLKNIEELRKIEDKINSTLEKTESLFIDKEMPVEFIDFLENISQNCQVPLNISPTFLRQTPNETWSFLGFQITAAGSFPNIRRFLEKLESSQYLIKIESLNITGLSKGELVSKEFEKLSPEEVKVNLVLKVFGK